MMDKEEGRKEKTPGASCGGDSANDKSVDKKKSADASDKDKDKKAGVNIEYILH